MATCKAMAMPAQDCQWESSPFANAKLPVRFMSAPSAHKANIHAITHTGTSREEIASAAFCFFPTVLRTRGPLRKRILTIIVPPPPFYQTD